MSGIKKAAAAVGIAAAVCAAIIAAILIMVQAGVFMPDKTERTVLVIASEDAEKTYDGKMLSCKEWRVVNGQLLPGHHLSVKAYGQQLTAGSSDNKISVRVFDEQGKDVTAEYDLSIYTGKLTVHKCTLRYSSGESKKEYDGTPLTGKGCVRMSEYRLPEGYTEEIVVLGTQTEVGTSDNAVSVTIRGPGGDDLTDNFNIVLYPGKLTVTPRPLTINTASDEKVFDGKPLINKEWSFANPDELVRGHRAEVVMNASLTAAGTIPNRPESIRVFDENGVDVTRNYNIILKAGQLTVRS